MQHENPFSAITVTRRAALASLGSGFGLLALRGLLSAQSGASPLHHAARAKRVIFLCRAGGPSHVDTFDYTPQLAGDDGKEPGGEYRRGARLMASPWKFAQHGKSGLWLSELFPELARHADRLCLLTGMVTDVPAHAQAFLKMHTGSFQFVRPSLGAWTVYGLGRSWFALPRP